MNYHGCFHSITNRYINTIMFALALVLCRGAASHAQAALHTFDDKAAFLTATAASSATGPLPDLGTVATLSNPTGSATIGSITFSMGPGAVDLYIGAGSTGAAPDWYPPTPENDITQGFESLQVQAATPVFALGFDFVEPNTTVQPWGGTPVDSTYEVTLFAGATEVGRFTFNAPDDVAAFVGVWNDVAFDRITIIDTTGSNDDEYFGEFYTGTQALSCNDDVCTVEDKAAFLAATEATAATGTDANGDFLPLPDLGEVKKEVIIGDITFKAKKLFVGTRGVPRVVNSDWTLRLPGPDIAFEGSANNSPNSDLAVVFAQPVFSVGFDFVEPEQDLNVGAHFVDSTYEITLKAGATPVGTVTFTPQPNDTALFVGVLSALAFNRVEFRETTVRGHDKAFLGRFYAGTDPVLTQRKPDAVVVDVQAGTNGRGMLFGVDPNGFRSVISDFGNAAQGPLGNLPSGVAVEASGDILVIDSGKLFRVNPVTGFRSVVSDFFNVVQGPVGSLPFGIAVDAFDILVTDLTVGPGFAPNDGALFSVSPVSGDRLLFSRFWDSSQGAVGEQPRGVAVEASGDILVVSDIGRTENSGALFRVNGQTRSGRRTRLSDFGQAQQGSEVFPFGVAVEASGDILVTYRGVLFSGLFRVDPETGKATRLSDFRKKGRPTSPAGVAVKASGAILIVNRDASAGTNGRGALLLVNPQNGVWTRLSDFGNAAQGPLGVDPIGVAVLPH